MMIMARKWINGAICDGCNLWLPFIHQLLKNFTRGGGGGWGGHIVCWKIGLAMWGLFPNNNQLIIGNLEIYTLYNVYKFLSTKMAIFVIIVITLGFANQVWLNSSSSKATTFSSKVGHLLRIIMWGAYDSPIFPHWKVLLAFNFPSIV